MVLGSRLSALGSRLSSLGSRGAAAPAGPAFGVAAGVVAAVLAWELALHPFARELRAPPVPDPACDSLSSDTVQTRQFEEGIALARYSRCGARLTGNAPVAGGETVVLLGDSHVAAREVADAETMGARLELLSRAAGWPLNVRQYGWRGAAPTLYIMKAPDVLARWDPYRVVVLLSEDDLGADLLRGTPRLGFDDDSALVLQDAEPLASDSAPPPLAPLAPSTMAVGSLVERRWNMLLARAPAFVRAVAGPANLDVDEHADDRLVPGAPDAVVRLLRDAYGDGLRVVFAADVRVTGGDTATTKEALLLRACLAERVRCVSTRAAMLEARNRGVIARGSPTTVLGVGHLNAAGHDLVARVMWEALR